MYNKSKVAVIIAAAGQGKRLGAPVPKQYLKIGGEYVISKTIRAFEDMEEVDYIFVVTNRDYISMCREIVQEGGFTKMKEIAAGGRERQDSVYNALQAVNSKEEDDILVLIHDGARPFVKSEVILNVIKETDNSGAAVACVAMTDSIRKIKETGKGSISVDRSDYYAVQTPQGFRKSLLMKAYEKAREDGYTGTDDASLVERTGHEVSMVEGSRSNVKITTKEDLPMENRVGTGFDVHRLVEGRKLVLGGVEIPYRLGLDGHSDADVLVHAVMDALLGAAAIGDIGKHFPDTDAAYKGASSIELLKQVKRLLDENLFAIGNIDVTLIAQKPKISPYTDEMRDNLAKALGLDMSRISIKGTTTERLGFTGRGEGIACEAVAGIYR